MASPGISVCDRGKCRCVPAAFQLPPRDSRCLGVGILSCIWSSSCAARQDAGTAMTTQHELYFLHIPAVLLLLVPIVVLGVLLEEQPDMR